MVDSDDAVPVLAAQSRATHVVVVGAGIAGLVAARECGKVGMRVTVLDAHDAVGGAVASAEVGGLVVDLGATCWSGRGGAVDSLVDELGLSDAVITPLAEGEWIAGVPGGAAPVPEATVAGIPSNPWAEDVRRIIGTRGAWRAYVDRLRPPLTIGQERSLGRLVSNRMGDRVRDLLVAPPSVSGFGIQPDDVDVEVVAPGLSTALTRGGTLGGAVAQLAGRERPGLRSLRGGMSRLVDGLVQHLDELGADVRTGQRATALAPAGDGRWMVSLAQADDSEPDALDAADAVIVAADEASARMLLAPHTGIPIASASLRRRVVTLLVDPASLRDVARGPVVHVVPGRHRAAGLVHETARWGGSGPHVVHVWFDGAPDEPPRHDAELVADAVAEASVLLGVPLSRTDVVASAHREFALSRPGSALGLPSVAAQARATPPGLWVVGGWVAGSGLARVVADARVEAERVRRALLFGRGDVTRP